MRVLKLEITLVVLIAKIDMSYFDGNYKIFWKNPVTVFIDMTIVILGLRIVYKCMK